MPVSALQDHLGFWLRFVSNHVSHGFARKLEANAVTVAEWVILRELYDRNEVAPSELATHVGLTRGAISKLAERLLAKQLLTRTLSEEDKRYQTLSLTAAARRLVPKLAALADANDRQFFSGLTAKERDALLATLKKLVQANQLSTIPID